MQDGILDCEQAKLRIQAYLDGMDASAELARHLANCESCREACLEAALRRRPAASAPAGFAGRVLTQIPMSPQAPAGIWPWAVAACLVLAVAGLAAVAAGLPAGLVHRVVDLVAAIQMRPRLLFSTLAVEGALALVFSWQAFRI